MKQCPVLLAIKNNRLVPIPDCREECLVKIRGKCLVHILAEYLRKIASVLS
ncbi:MAG: hypothetical protein AAGU11_18190 [Syntrophobacteraceae bacterium]